MPAPGRTSFAAIWEGGGWIKDIAGRLNSLLDNYLALCLLLSLVILTLTGVGGGRTAGLLGLLLCLAGLTRPAPRADRPILTAMLAGTAAGLISTWVHGAALAESYAPALALFPLLCLLAGCMEAAERQLARRLYLWWATAVAVMAMGQFIWRAVTLGSVQRMGGFLGNPNALGIFLVIAWLALPADFPRWTEPLLLAALAMTLSMGSFLAMAAGVLCRLTERRKERAAYACTLLARASLGVGTGLLIYLAAGRTGLPWLCLPLLGYLLVLAVSWERYERFLAAYPWMAAAISGIGVLAAAVMAVLRPSAAATFAQRLEMMASGLGYLPQYPLIGVGPYQWRLLDLYDGGTYFNTWHIHNAFLHLGVELGWLAMAALAAVVVLAWRRGRERPVLAAFCLHNLIDTSFFYLGITALVLLLTAEGEGKRISKALYVVLAVLFACMAVRG